MKTLTVQVGTVSCLNSSYTFFFNQFHADNWQKDAARHVLYPSATMLLNNGRFPVYFVTHAS